MAPGLFCQVCLVDCPSIGLFKEHLRSTAHQQKKAELFQKAVYQGLVFLNSIDILGSRPKYPKLGLSLVTLCLGSKNGSIFYLCHACQDSFLDINKHFDSTEHCQNYYNYTNPDVLRFSWIPSSKIHTMVDPVAHSNVKKNWEQHTGRLQALDLPPDVFETVKGTSYVKAMATLSQNDNLLKQTTAARPKRMTIQTYLGTPNRKHPFLGLEHLVECSSEEQTDRRLYLCTVCKLTLTDHKIISHLLGFDHIRCYINAWHPSTLLSSYNDTYMFRNMMQDLAKQMEEIHGTTITDMKQVVLRPALFSSVEGNSYVDALATLEHWSKIRKESSLITSITPGDKLVHIPGKMIINNASKDPASVKESNVATEKKVSAKTSETVHVPGKMTTNNASKDPASVQESNVATEKKVSAKTSDSETVHVPGDMEPIITPSSTSHHDPVSVKESDVVKRKEVAEQRSDTMMSEAKKTTAEPPGGEMTAQHPTNTEPQTTVSKLEEAKHPSCILSYSCQVCNVKFKTSYVSHVKGYKHKLAMKTIFGTEADELENEPVFYILKMLKECHHIKKRPKAEPVIGLLHIVTCVSTRATIKPFCLCRVCKWLFPATATKFIDHLRGPLHIQQTLMHQSPARLPFAWKEKENYELLKSLAWEEEKAQGPEHMVLKIIDLPSRILSMLCNSFPHGFKTVCETLNELYNGWTYEVPKIVRLHELQQTISSDKYPLLGLQFLVRHTSRLGSWRSVCLLCERNLDELEFSSHVFSLEHVKKFLTKVHPGSLNCEAKRTPDMLLDFAKQAAEIHSPGHIQKVRMSFHCPYNYRHAVIALQRTKDMEGGKLFPGLPVGEKLVPTETLKEIDSDLGSDTSPEMTKKPEGDADTPQHPDVKDPTLQPPDVKDLTPQHPDVKVPTLQPPDVKDPTLQPPDVKDLTPQHPDVKVPTLQHPDVKVPTLQPPDVKDPTLQPPDVKDPTLQPPDVKVPTLQPPDVKDPTLQPPDVKVPTLQPPDVKDPTLQPPDVMVPTLQPPDVKVPTPKHPDVKVPTLQHPDVKVPTPKHPDVKDPSHPDVKVPTLQHPDVKIPTPKHPDVKDLTPQPIPVEKEAVSKKLSCVHKPGEKKKKSPTQNTSVERRADTGTGVDRETLKQSTEEQRTEKDQSTGSAVELTGRGLSSESQETTALKRKRDAVEEEAGTERDATGEDTTTPRVGGDFEVEKESGTPEKSQRSETAVGPEAAGKRQRLGGVEERSACEKIQKTCKEEQDGAADVRSTGQTAEALRDVAAETNTHDQRVTQKDFRKEKELVAEQDTLHGLEPNAPHRPADAPAASQVTHDIQVSPTTHPQGLQTPPSTSDCQPRANTLVSDVQDKPFNADLQQHQVEPPTDQAVVEKVRSQDTPEDMEPTVSSTALWDFINSISNPKRKEPVIGLSMMTELQWPDKDQFRNRFRCDCCCEDMGRSRHVSHILSGKHRYNYIKKVHPHMVDGWPRPDRQVRQRTSPKLLDLAQQVERDEGWGRFKVTVMGSSTSQYLKPTATIKTNQQVGTTSNVLATNSKLAISSKTTVTTSKPAAPSHAATISSATSAISRTTANSKPIAHISESTTTISKCTTSTTTSKPSTTVCHSATVMSKPTAATFSNTNPDISKLSKSITTIYKPTTSMITSKPISSWLAFNAKLEHRSKSTATISKPTSAGDASKATSASDKPVTTSSPAVAQACGTAATPKNKAASKTSQSISKTATNQHVGTTSNVLATISKPTTPMITSKPSTCPVISESQEALWEAMDAAFITGAASEATRASGKATTISSAKHAISKSTTSMTTSKSSTTVCHPATVMSKPTATFSNTTPAIAKMSKSTATISKPSSSTGASSKATSTSGKGATTFSATVARTCATAATPNNEVVSKTSETTQKTATSQQVTETSLSATKTHTTSTTCQTNEDCSNIGHIQTYVRSNSDDGTQKRDTQPFISLITAVPPASSCGSSPSESLESTRQSESTTNEPAVALDTLEAFLDQHEPSHHPDGNETSQRPDRLAPGSESPPLHTLSHDIRSESPQSCDGRWQQGGSQDSTEWQEAPRDSGIQPCPPQYSGTSQKAPHDPGIQPQNPAQRERRSIKLEEAQKPLGCPDRRPFFDSSGHRQQPVLQPLPRSNSAGKSRVSHFLSVKLSEAERKKVVGLPLIVECQCEISKGQRLSPFYMCRCCQQQVQINHVCNHVISIDHQRKYMWKESPSLMAGIWNVENLSEEQKIKGFEMTVNMVAEREHFLQRDAEVRLLDKDSYHRVRVAPFSEGIHILEDIWRQQHLTSCPPAAQQPPEAADNKHLKKGLTEATPISVAIVKTEPVPEPLTTLNAHSSNITEMRKPLKHGLDCVSSFGDAGTVKRRRISNSPHGGGTCDGPSNLYSSVSAPASQCPSPQNQEARVKVETTPVPTTVVSQLVQHCEALQMLPEQKLELVLKSLKTLVSSNFNLDCPPTKPASAASTEPSTTPWFIDSSSQPVLQSTLSDAKQASPPLMLTSVTAVPLSPPANKGLPSSEPITSIVEVNKFQHFASLVRANQSGKDASTSQESSENAIVGRVKPRMQLDSNVNLRNSCKRAAPKPADDDVWNYENRQFTPGRRATNVIGDDDQSLESHHRAANPAGEDGHVTSNPPAARAVSSTELQPRGDQATQLYCNLSNLGIGNAQGSTATVTTATTATVIDPNTAQALQASIYNTMVSPFNIGVGPYMGSPITVVNPNPTSQQFTGSDYSINQPTVSTVSPSGSLPAAGYGTLVYPYSQLTQNPHFPHGYPSVTGAQSTYFTHGYPSGAGTQNSYLTHGCPYGTGPAGSISQASDPHSVFSLLYPIQTPPQQGTGQDVMFGGTYTTNLTAEGWLDVQRRQRPQ